MSTRNLSSVSRECVLAHMDQNFRIYLSTITSPPMHELNIIALQFQNVELSPFTIKLDNTTYRLSIIVDFWGVETPAWAEQQNKDGGVQYDIGEFGDPLEPRFMARLDRKLPDAEEDERVEVYKKLEDVLNEITLLSPCVDHNTYNADRIVVREQEAEKLRKMIRNFNERKTLCKAVREHVQFTVTKEGNTLIIEQLKYDRPLREMMDYLIQKRLMGYRRSIGAVNLHYKDWKGSDLQLRVQNLTIDDESKDEGFMHIISPISIPLTTVTTPVLESCQHPIIATAGILYLSKANRMSLAETLRNPRIHFNRSYFSFPVVIINITTQMMRIFNMDNVVEQTFTLEVSRETANRAVNLFQQQQGVNRVENLVGLLEWQHRHPNNKLIHFKMESARFTNDVHEIMNVTIRKVPIVE